MPVAFANIDAEIGKIDSVLNEILKIDEVVEAYSVSGPHGIIAKIEAKKFDEITDVIPECIHEIEGVTGTLTQVAFGVSKEHRMDGCEEAKDLAEEGKMEELYELCKNCGTLKHCSYGARVITYGF